MNSLIQLARMEQAEKIKALIEASARELSRQDYTPHQIEAALTSAWGLDTQLVKDETYYVITLANDIIGCGGWSFRKTLFGGDGRKDRDNQPLNPATDAAKIRAFFIHPDHARTGLGRQLLIHCEQQAWDHGFRRLELGATLPGQRLYQTMGYTAGEPYDFATGPQATLTIIPMFKTLSARPGAAASS